MIRNSQKHVNKLEIKDMFIEKKYSHDCDKCKNLILILKNLF